MKILLMSLALALLASASQAQTVTSTARTACENCPFGGDYLQSARIEARFLSLPLNKGNGRNEGPGTLTVGGIGSPLTFVDTAAQFSVLIVGGVLSDVAATGTIPGGGNYTLSTLSIIPSGPWYDIKMQIVSTPRIKTKFQTTGEGPVLVTWGRVKNDYK